MNALKTKPSILIYALGTAVFAGVLAGATAQNATTQPDTNTAARMQAQPQGRCNMEPGMMKKMMGKMNGGEGMQDMCPMCATMMGNMGGQDGDMMAQCQNMMGQMGMSEDMVKRWDTMMRTPIFMNSPCAIYGQAETLNLTEEQKQQLIDIENQARAKSMAVLTDEQRETLGDLPDKPMPMMEMCGQMKSRMMPMMQQKMQKMKGKMGMSPDKKPGAGSCCSDSGS
jgi:hypothetical protein